MDGRIVLAGLASCVLVTVLTPPGHWPRLAGEAALIAAAHAGLSLQGRAVGETRRWLARLSLMGPALLAVLIALPFLTAVPGQPPPLEQAGTAAARALLSFAALAAALRAVEAPELLQALARLRLPTILVTLIALMLRYLGLLEDEAARMIRARDLRGTPPTVRGRATVAGSMVGSLFLRSVERSERVSVAMQARGFTGLLPSPDPRAVSARDWLTLVLLVLVQALLLGYT
jgi:cobalt/nickel transport system permease protein